MIKTLKVNTLLENKFYRVENNIVQFDGGFIGEHLKVLPREENGIAVLPFDADGNAIIQDEFRYALNCYSTEVVKGGADKTHTIEQNARRELEEELGLVAERLIKIGACTERGSFVTGVATMFIALNCVPKENSCSKDESETFSNRRKLKMDDLVSEVMNGKIRCVTSQAVILIADNFIKNRL
jgi:hypothetical protein